MKFVDFEILSLEELSEEISYEECYRDSDDEVDYEAIEYMQETISIAEFLESLSLESSLA